MLVNPPLVSIIMGIYNCQDTLAEAIESLLAQTYSNWQLIMCDDCSTDRTYEVAAGFQKSHSDRIILVKNERNSRLAYSLNHCLKYTNGKYVARMDGDDLSVPERLEKQVAFLESHPDIQLVGSAMRFFDQNGLKNIRYKAEYPDALSMRRRVPFHHATIMMRKSVYDSLNGYTVCPRTERGQDLDLWFRFFKAGFKGVNLSEVLYLVREDDMAFKRRSFHVRWITFQTTRYGFKLLGFPKWWIVRPALKMLIMSIMPFFVWNLLLKWQARKTM